MYGTKLELSPYALPNTDINLKPGDCRCLANKICPVTFTISHVYVGINYDITFLITL
jgi:hypothetical protein